MTAAHDPVSTVASWLTIDNSGDGNIPTDPVLSMIAEYRRLLARAAEIRDRAEKIGGALPETIERQPWLDKVMQATTEDLRKRRKEFFPPEFFESGDRLRVALAAAGVPALEKEAEGLERQAGALMENIKSTPAISWDGLLAQLASLKEDIEFDGAEEDDGHYIATIAKGVMRLRTGTRNELPAIRAEQPSKPHPPFAFPIATAPVKPGRRFGPCLLWPWSDEWHPQPHWTLGRWECGGWCVEAGFFFRPTHWCPLPKNPGAA